MKTVKSALAIAAVCAVSWSALYFALRLSNRITEERGDSALQAELGEVLPESGRLEAVTISDKALPQSVTEAYSDGNGGMVFRMSVTGYAPGMVLLCGIRDGRVVGAACTESRETLGQEKAYGAALVGKDLTDIGTAETVSGATLTTTAYRSAVTDALVGYDILVSGESK